MHVGASRAAARRFRAIAAVRVADGARLSHKAGGARETKRRKEGSIVKGFLERLQWKLAGMMQGRRGADTLSSFLMVVGIVLLLVSIVPGLDVLSWVALIALAYALFRSYSKNVAARDRENAAFERAVEKPRKQLSLARKAWANRKTTRYFKCKGCGQVLSVPRGKGTLRVVCPKCKTESTMKS